MTSLPRKMRIMSLGFSGILLVFLTAGCAAPVRRAPVTPREAASRLPSNGEVYFYLDYQQNRELVEPFVPAAFPGDITFLQGTINPSLNLIGGHRQHIQLWGDFSSGQISLGLGLSRQWKKQDDRRWVSSEQWQIALPESGLLVMEYPSAAAVGAVPSGEGLRLSPEAAAQWGEAPGMVVVPQPSGIFSLPGGINLPLEEMFFTFEPREEGAFYHLTGEILCRDERTAQALPRAMKLFLMIQERTRFSGQPGFMKDLTMENQGRRLFFTGLRLSREHLMTLAGVEPASSPKK